GESDPAGLAFSPDSKILAAAALEPEREPEQGAIKLWDVASAKAIRQIKPPKRIRASVMTFSPDGKILAYGGGGVVHVCQVDKGQEIGSWRAPGGGVRTLAFPPDGKKLVSRGGTKRTRQWETTTGQERQELAEAAPPRRGGSGGFLMFAAAQAGRES